MTIVRSVYELVIDRWVAEGVVPGTPCSLRELEVFESLHSVALPAQVRCYLTAANGMREGVGRDQDSDGFSFWPLRRWQPAIAEQGALEGVTSVDELRNLFVFADYMTWSWAYAIALDRLRQEASVVWLVGDGIPYIVAETFDAFLDSYLDRSAALMKR